MKKTLSIILAALLVACTLVPAFAAGGKVNVTFHGPSAQLETYGLETPAYVYYQTKQGEFCEFVEDENGGYGFYHVDGCYYFIDDLTDNSRKVFDEAEPGSPESVRYSPAQCESGQVDQGSSIAFKVFTNEAYDADTLVVLCNGVQLQLNAYGEYVVIANSDLDISVMEIDSATNSQMLMPNHYTVSLTSGDGYAAKPLINNNNKVVYYGGDYEFRVKITKGFNGDSMQVKVIRGTSFLSEYLGEEADTLSSFLGEAETLSSTGVDQEGCRTYKIKDITSDCKVLISGVNQDSSSGILATLKRILRLILGLLGIKLDGLLGEGSNPLAAYTVSLDATAADSDGITYTANPEFKYNNESGNYEAEVLNGECITIVLKTTREEFANPNRTRVTWVKADEPDKIYGNDYTVSWQAYYDLKNDRTYWTAVWYIDGINCDTAIKIATGNG